MSELDEGDDFIPGTDDVEGYAAEARAALLAVVTVVMLEDEATAYAPDSVSSAAWRGLDEHDPTFLGRASVDLVIIAAHHLARALGIEASEAVRAIAADSAERGAEYGGDA